MERFNYRTKIYPKYTSRKSQDFTSLSEEDYLRWGEAVGAYVSGWLPKDKNACCLDVACGAGQMLHLLKTAGYSRLTGIDISPEQVSTSRKIWPYVIETSAVDFLKKHPVSYDLITGFDIVEHFSKDELFEFLESLYGALRPGGVLILQTPNAESPFGFKVRYGDLTHEVAFDSAVLAHLLSVTGFVNTEARECGPYVRGIKSLVRAALWRLIRQGIVICNLVETGTPGSGVLTRVFEMKAEKPK